MIWSIFGAGFLLGLTHAFEADHVAAVSTIVSQTKNLKWSLLAGISWGVGHTATLLAAAVFIVFFRLQLPAMFAPILDLVVGIVLILLGLNLFRKIGSEKIHFHVHEHGDQEHAHFHSHARTPKHRHNHRSFLLGVLHGLAGSAALMLLVLATVKTAAGALSYILVFGLGSIIGMATLSIFIGLPFVWLAQCTNLQRTLRAASALASIAIGAVMVKVFFLPGI